MSNPIDIDQLRSFFEKHFPLSKELLTIESVDASGRATVFLDGTNPQVIRPGGTVSGPGMFTLADVGSYLAIIGMVGEGGLMAVTSNSAMDFLARPKQGLVRGEFTVLKLGRTLTVIDGRIYGPDERLVARSNFTYAMPQQK